MKRFIKLKGTGMKSIESQDLVNMGEDIFNAFAQFGIYQFIMFRRWRPHNDIFISVMQINNLVSIRDVNIIIMICKVIYCYIK